MRRRNRKKKDINGFIVPAPFAGVIIILSSLAVGYLWLDSRCQILGRELKALDAAGQEMDKNLRSDEYKWSLMKSPANIERALKRHNIAMSWPRRDQIVVVYRDTSLLRELLAENAGASDEGKTMARSSSATLGGESFQVVSKSHVSPEVMKYAGSGKVAMSE